MAFLKSAKVRLSSQHRNASNSGNQLFRVLISACVLLGYGCSSSNDASQENNPLVPVTPGVASPTANGPVAPDSSEPADVQVTPMEQNQDAVVPLDTNPEMNEPNDNEGGVHIESESTLVRVNYQIEVPKFQSNQLVLKLTWGQATTTAQWQSDELWIASLELPNNKQDTLVVTFYDRNGAVVLASYEAIFNTGSEATKSLSISAEQFDISRWDSDEDGMSNLDELILGTDPLYDEYVNAIVVDEFFVSVGINAWEGRITNARPYEESVEEIPPVPEQGPPRGLTHTLEINIDSSGNGTVVEYRQCCLPPWYVTKWDAVRTATNESVSWAGTNSYYDSEYAHSENTEFEYIVTNIDTGTYRYVGSNQFTSAASYSEIKNTQVNIVTQRIENTMVCEPLYGEYSYTRTGSTWDPAETNLEVNVRKLEADTYWKVQMITLDLATEQETVEYQLANKLSGKLECNFVEI